MVFSSWVHESLVVSDNFMRLGQDGALAPGLGEFAEKRVRWLFAHPGVGEFWLSKGREPHPDAPAVQLADQIVGVQASDRSPTP